MSSAELFPVCTARVQPQERRVSTIAEAPVQLPHSERQSALWPGDAAHARTCPDGEESSGPPLLHDASTTNRLGIVTWNVNGLLPCIKRMGFKHLDELLSSFATGVSIVCLQETKLVRSQLDQSLARPTGWDAFYSFSTLPPSVAKVDFPFGVLYVHVPLSQRSTSRLGFRNTFLNPAALHFI